MALFLGKIVPPLPSSALGRAWTLPFGISLNALGSLGPSAGDSDLPRRLAARLCHPHVGVPGRHLVFALQLAVVVFGPLLGTGPARSIVGWAAGFIRNRLGLMALDRAAVPHHEN